MLLKAKALYAYALDAQDGQIGKVKDFYFDDRTWTTRYLVADTGTWLGERLVLVSPHAVLSVDAKAESIAIRLTRKQIEDSPWADSEKPVSRQFETVYHEYYGWPDWGSLYQWAAYPVPESPIEIEVQDEESSWDEHLGSTREVAGYRVAAADGEIGHVADFVIDGESWAIRYVDVETRNWWPGRHVLMSPEWMERVSWTDHKVFVDLSREAIERAPEYSPDTDISREYEARLCRHYGREGYWSRADCTLGPEDSGGKTPA